jgi:hypothetical protein
MTTDEIRNLPLFDLQALISDALAELFDRSQSKRDPDLLTFRVVPPCRLCADDDRSVCVVVRLEHETASEDEPAATIDPDD